MSKFKVAPKVTVAQIREFVEHLKTHPVNDGRSSNQAILDFIDNGPKKPTPEEVAQQAVADWQSEEGYDGFNEATIAVLALRKAGYIKDDE